MPEIDNRCDISGLCQIVGIIVQLADISDQDARQELLTDIGRHDLIPHMHLIVGIGQFDQIQGALVNQPKVPGNDTLVGGR